jgi:hypothetical protein
MKILWDSGKNRRLKSARRASFDDVAPIILAKRYLAVLENPSRADQMIFLVWWRNYTFVVRFEIDAESNLVLKTVFPSRKFHRLYGAKKIEDQT